MISVTGGKCLNRQDWALWLSEKGKKILLKWRGRRNEIRITAAVGKTVAVCDYNEHELHE